MVDPVAPQRRPLRRAQISFAAMWAGESAFMVGLAVLAFRDGGVAAVGAVTAIRTTRRTMAQGIEVVAGVGQGQGPDPGTWLEWAAGYEAAARAA